MTALLSLWAVARSPLGRGLAIILVALAVGGGLYLKGRSDESAVWKIRVAAMKAEAEKARQVERDRQQKINDAALAEARAEAAAQADANDLLNRQLEENAHVAAQDPDRDLCGLGAAGVRRVDGVH